MRPPDDPEVAAWLTKAEADMLMAGLAMESEKPLWDHACFHAQQAAEKCLKALMIACELWPPRTHDLVFLLEHLAEHFPAIQELAEKAAVLSQYGVLPRYPSFLDPVSETAASDAVKYAAELCARARGCLKVS